jgi:uroporphyrinogen-III synthase
MDAHVLMRDVTLLVTRPHGPSERLFAAAQRFGMHVESVPLLDIQYRVQDGDIHVLEHLGEFDLVVATSANGLRGLERAAVQAGCRLEETAPPCVTVGATTAKVATRLGLHATYPVGGRTAQDLAAWIAEQYPPGLNIVWPCGQLADRRFAGMLTEQGFRVRPWVCYETVVKDVPSARWREVLAGGGVHVLMLYSPSAVQALARHVDVLDSLSADIRYAVVGPTTAQALREQGLTVWCMASKPSDERFVESIAWTLRTEEGHPE